MFERHMAHDQVIAQRTGRVAFGVALLVGVAVLGERAASGRTLHAGIILPISWATAFAAYAGAKRVARRPGVHPDASRLAASLVVPGIGISLTLPLLLHLPIAMLVTGPHRFDDWVRLSCCAMGPTHLALAILVTVRGIQLTTHGRALTPTRIYWLTVAASCVPWVVFLGIPPLMVAVTGLPFIPLLRHMATIVDRERGEIGAASTLPRAIALGA